MDSKPAEETAAVSTGAARREAEKNLSRIERALAKLAEEETSLHQEMALHDQTDYEGLNKLADRARELNANRDRLESEWLETSEKLA
jgi:hypothetical protein